MATLRNERKLAAVNRNSKKEYRRNNLSRDMNIPGINEEYITQVSEVIKGRMIKKYRRSSVELVVGTGCSVNVR